MASLLNPALVPGYKSNAGPPEDYVSPGQTRWTKNKFANNRFGLHKRSDGLFELISLHRVRALDLVGSRTVNPGQPFTTGVSAQLHLFFENQRAVSIADMPSTQSDVTIDFRATSFLIDDTRYVTASINGQIIGLAFRFSGEAGGLSTDQIVISLGTWNELYGGNGEPVQVDFAFEPVDSFTGDEDWLTFEVTYAGADEEDRHFVNEEVAFPHIAHIERRGDGLFQPVAVYEPIREFGPRVTRGVAWRIVDDPRDTQMRFWNPRLPLPHIPSEWPELGPSGQFCFVIPMETLDLAEGAFASYGVICGDQL